MAAASGFRYLPGALDLAGQHEVVTAVRSVVERAPLYRPTMPRTGRPFSVRMSNAGSHGWMADKRGYRYDACHPLTGEAWPPIPGCLLALWRQVSGYAASPECCLINYYDATARMGLHQDRDELDDHAPVVSLSLGDSAVFRLGGTTRKAPTRSMKLHSGDVVILAGGARFAFHGVDRILAGSSRLLPNGGRINVTLRRVNPAMPDNPPDEASMPD